MAKNGNHEQAMHLAQSELTQLAQQYGASGVSLGREISIAYPFSSTKLPVDKIIVADEQMKRLGGYAYTRQDEEYFDYRHWSTGDAEHDSKHIMDFLKACEVQVSQDTAARVVYEKVGIQRLIAVVPTGRRAFRRGPREAEIYASLSRRTLYDDKPSVLMTHTRPYISVRVTRVNLQYDNVRKAVDLMASLFHQ